MNACSTCGFENDPTRVFCQNCGTRLEIAHGADTAGGHPGQGHTGETSEPPMERKSSCGTCGFENASTRTFCQNCGARLETIGSPHAPGKTRARRHGKALREASVHGAAAWGKLLFVLAREVVSIAILAAMTATLVQSLRPPDGLPAIAQPKPALISVLAADIQEARHSLYPRAFHISMDQANTFLATRLKGLDGQAGFLSARFERAYVRIAENTLILGTEQSLRSWPVYLQLGFDVSASSSGSTANIVSGTIGRVSLPRMLLPYFARSFQGVIEGLQTPISWFSTAAEIKLSPDGADILWVGGDP